MQTRLRRLSLRCWHGRKGVSGRDHPSRRSPRTVCGFSRVRIRSLLTLASRGVRLGLLITSSIPARCFWPKNQRAETVDAPRLASSSNTDVLSGFQFKQREVYSGSSLP